MPDTAKRLREIEPKTIYPLTVYEGYSGITPTRRREARLQGVELETVNVGRRKFVMGSAGIDFILRLAALGDK